MRNLRHDLISDRRGREERSAGKTFRMKTSRSMGQCIPCDIPRLQLRCVYLFVQVGCNSLLNFRRNCF